MSDLHQAIEQLDATLHPRPQTIELTETMRISPLSGEKTEDDLPAANREDLINEIVAAIQKHLPSIVAEAVEQALSNQTKPH